MKRRLLFMAVASAFVAALWALPASAGPLPSGERINGGTNGNGGTVIEPVYDDMTGQIRYVSTPRGVPNPVKSNPIASAPFYLPVYPGNAAVGTLNCQDQPTENCPDHGPAVAGLAELLQPGVYNATNGGVLGHDHLMAGPGSGGDFNVAWVPTLVLFTKSEYVTHITLLSQVTTLFNEGKVQIVPLDGTNGFPNLTFHCSVVSAAVYDHSQPFNG
jgi:hypothetical protein